MIKCSKKEYNEVFSNAKTILKKHQYSTSVGDEGGFAPNLPSNEAALEMIVQAIEKAGYRPGSQVTLALDCAATEFFDKSTRRYVEKKKKKRHRLRQMTRQIEHSVRRH